MIFPCLDKLLHHKEKDHSNIWHVRAGWKKSEESSVLTTGELHADNILSFQPEKIYISHLEKETINFKN